MILFFSNQQFETYYFRIWQERHTDHVKLGLHALSSFCKPTPFSWANVVPKWSPASVSVCQPHSILYCSVSLMLNRSLVRWNGLIFEITRWFVRIWTSIRSHMVASCTLVLSPVRPRTNRIVPTTHTCRAALTVKWVLSIPGKLSFRPWITYTADEREKTWRSSFVVL